MSEEREITGGGDAPEEERADLALFRRKARIAVSLASRAALWIVLVGIVVFYSVEGVRWVFKALTGVLLLVVLSIFFAYFIAPFVEFVRRPFNLRGQKREMPRWLAIAIVYVTLFGSLALAGWLIYPSLNEQMTQLAQNAPSYINNLRNSSAALRVNRIYQRLPPATREVIDQRVTASLSAAGEGALNVAVWLGYLPWLVLIPILAFFFLKDADSFRRSALRMLPQGRLRWRGDEFFQDVNSTLAAYIRAQLIACLLIGSLCTIGFAIIGIRYTLVLGVVAGFLEFIPLLGPVVVAVLALTVAGFDSVGKAVAVFIFLAVLRIVHDYVTYPRIIGSGIHLHPLAVILAILSGHEIAGVAGIFLAIPVIAVLTVTYRHWLEHRGSTGLVAELLKPAGQAAAVAPAPGDAEPPEAPPEPRPIKG
ncbi:MAG TPA: AI-2E family transporter [Pyrinomonadaceae bacterium]|nr:AI-2E family transporter [Pyrinomonadaceae bacterium]